MVCAIDQQTLNPPTTDFAQITVGRAAGADAPTTSRDNSDLVFPEYRWSQRDAWKFLGMTMVFGSLWYVVTGALYSRFPNFYQWRRGPLGFLMMDLIYAGIHITLAAYFGRTESFSSFCKAVGLDRKPSNYVWFGLVAAFGIRLFGHILLASGLLKGYTAYDLRAFRHTQGSERYLFLLPLLLAPFWEEAVNRGFLYKAFRGSYSVRISMALIVGYTCYTHRDQYFHSVPAVIDLSALTVVQCWLREKSDCLWDCISCHLAFNGSLLFMGGLLRY
jgi:membrane protease YdiL (CAAX protease family)